MSTVVVGDPEREVYQGGWHRVEHLPGSGNRDSAWSLDPDLDDDAPRRAPPSRTWTMAPFSTPAGTAYVKMRATARDETSG